MIEIYGLIFTFILGTVGHFLYDITNNKLIGFFFSKSESIWEHLKLGITPILIWTIIEKFRMDTSFLFSIKGIQITTFSIFIILSYFIYRLIFKKRNAIYDISSFYVGVTLSFIVSLLLLNMIRIPILIIILGYLLLVINIGSYFYLNKTKKKLWITKEPKQELKKK